MTEKCTNRDCLLLSIFAAKCVFITLHIPNIVLLAMYIHASMCLT